jgi:tRNA(Arg) A34 adenosine deaminase TadA
MVLLQCQGGNDPVTGSGLSFDESMMAHALDLAREARNLGEVPVGAVVVRGDRFVAT